MRWSLTFVIGLSLALAIPPARAMPLPDGGVSAEQVAAALRSVGYAAEVSTDKSGDPLVRSKSGGAKFGIFFYQCGNDARCRSIQFSAGFTQRGVKPAAIGEWNRTKRFGRAYQDKTADPWVEMDMDTTRGVSSDALEANIERWIAVLSEFQRTFAR